MAGAASPLYLGLISGTSADGIDAALVRFAPRLQVVAADTAPYPNDLRRRVLALTQGRAAVSLEDFGRLDAELGARFGAAALRLLRGAGIDPSSVRAIGSHGQTVCHRPQGPFPFTLQIGDPNVIAAHTGILTVADFRRADVAAGGQGAPLLPALHAAVLADPVAPRAVLNLGGIANLTLLRPGQPVRGFDTGPANCLIDAWWAKHHGTPHDQDGAWARSGHVDPDLLTRLLDDPYFAALPPKSTGRGYFNLDWLTPRLHGAGAQPANVQATLLQLTVRSATDALRTHAAEVHEVYVCGGGVHNGALMAALRAALHDVRVDSTAALGLAADCVEAVGFAWLARARLEGRPGNLPSVTGARGPCLLGGVYGPVAKSS